MSLRDQMNMIRDCEIRKDNTEQKNFNMTQNSCHVVVVWLHHVYIIREVIECASKINLYLRYILLLRSRFYSMFRYLTQSLNSLIAHSQ